MDVPFHTQTIVESSTSTSTPSPSLRSPATNRPGSLRAQSRRHSKLDTEAPRVRATKSRNGCGTCKKARLKCDEAKPCCNNCTRRGKQDTCRYIKSWKWCSFGVSGDILQQATMVQSNGATEDEHAAISTLETSLRSSQPSGGPQSTTTREAAISDHADKTVSAAASLQTADSYSEESSNSLVAETPKGSGAVTSAGLPHSELPISSQQPKVPLTDPSMFSSSSWNIMNEELAHQDLQSFCDIDISALIPPDVDDILAMAAFDDPTLELLLPGSADELTLGQASLDLLIARFHDRTCGIMSVNDGPRINPWRTYVWDMAQTAPALLHSLCAMSAFHFADSSPAIRKAGVYHYGECMKSLRDSVGNHSMTADAVLATGIALAFAEGWLEHTTNVNHHIQAARESMKVALDHHRAFPRVGASLDRLKFLCNAWLYLDVLSRITSLDSDPSDCYDDIFGQSEIPSIATDGFGVDFGIALDTKLDPLMGCASTLFPLIGRVANVVSSVWRGSTRTLAIKTTAADLKYLLERWAPPTTIESAEDDSGGTQDSVNTAEAYRWATLLHLQQSVPEVASEPTAALAQKVLSRLAVVKSSSRFFVVHIFPMMVGGCEATDPEDRRWVLGRWDDMARRLRIGSIRKCVEVTEEVWARRDATAAAAHSEHPPLPASGAGGTAAMATDVVSPSSRSSPQRSDRSPADPQARPWSGDPHWLSVMRDWNWEGESAHFGPKRSPRKR